MTDHPTNGYGDAHRHLRAAIATTPTASERLDAVIEQLDSKGEDLRVTLTVESECAWSGELRHSPYPAIRIQGDAEVSLTLYVTGAATPDEVIHRLLATFEDMDGWQKADTA